MNTLKKTILIAATFATLGSIAGFANAGVMSPRDSFTDGSHTMGTRDPFTDGAHSAERVTRSRMVVTLSVRVNTFFSDGA
ncbi:hypothetical protein [Cupriavidus basilensis]